MNASVRCEVATGEAEIDAQLSRRTSSQVISPANLLQLRRAKPLCLCTQHGAIQLNDGLRRRQPRVSGRHHQRPCSQRVPSTTWYVRRPLLNCANGYAPHQSDRRLHQTLPAPSLFAAIRTSSIAERFLIRYAKNALHQHRE